MSVTYSTATKTARMNAVVTQIGTSGKIKFRTAADVLLATFTLAATAGTVSGDTLTFSDANGGTAGILNTTSGRAHPAASSTGRRRRHGRGSGGCCEGGNHNLC